MPGHEPNNDSRHFLQIVGTKNFAIAICSAIGAAVCWSALGRAREQGNYDALLSLGFLVFALSVTSMLCIAVPLVRRIKACSGRRKTSSTKILGPTGEYEARYSAQDQIIS